MLLLRSPSHTLALWQTAGEGSLFRGLQAVISCAGLGLLCWPERLPLSAQHLQNTLQPEEGTRLD